VWFGSSLTASGDGAPAPRDKDRTLSRDADERESTAQRGPCPSDQLHDSRVRACDPVLRDAVGLGGAETEAGTRVGAEVGTGVEGGRR
jgi:hypothetical protein